MKRTTTKDATTPTRPRYEGPDRQARGAVRPGTIPPNSTVPKPLPPIDPAKVVSGASTGAIKSDDGPSRTFQLPESVSAREIRDQSFRYGGGRSGGRLSTKR
jgi:hypothetical protein